MADIEILGLRKIGSNISPQQDIVGRSELYAHALGVQIPNHLITIRPLGGFDTVDKALGNHQINFPVDLAFMSPLEEKHWWQVYHQNAITGLFFATSEPTESGNINQADTIIEYNAAIANLELKPCDLRVTTIVPDSTQRQRILSTVYLIDEKNDLQLKDMGVSIARRDLPDRTTDRDWYYEQRDTYIGENIIPSAVHTHPDMHIPTTTLLTDGMTTHIPDDVLLKAPNSRNSMAYARAFFFAGYLSIPNDKTVVFSKTNPETRTLEWEIEFPNFSPARNK